MIATVARLALVLAAAAAGATGVRRLLRRRGAGGAGRRRGVAEQNMVCECGARYRAVGTGRHRVVWPADAGQQEALMAGECPQCGRSLDQLRVAD